MDTKQTSLLNKYKSSELIESLFRVGHNRPKTNMSSEFLSLTQTSVIQLNSVIKLKKIIVKIYNYDNYLKCDIFPYTKNPVDQNYLVYKISNYFKWVNGVKAEWVFDIEASFKDILHSSSICGRVDMYHPQLKEYMAEYIITDTEVPFQYYDIKFLEEDFTVKNFYTKNIQHPKENPFIKNRITRFEK